METQKNVNLLNGSDNQNSKFATKKWHVIDSESKGVYSHENSIKFLTGSSQSSFCDYSDAYVLVTANNNSSSFKYKSNLIGNTVADEANRKKEGVKIVVPLKHLSNFSRSLEILLIKCKVELSLTWSENCVLNNVAGNSTFQITDTKLYDSLVTLST